MSLVIFHIGDMVLPCTQRNLDIHVTVNVINSSTMVYNRCVLFVQVPAMFIFYSTNRDKCKQGTDIMLVNWRFSTTDKILEPM